MSDVSNPEERGPDRVVAMVGYGLLIASIFFLGVPAVVAAVIAYTQRDDAPPVARSHFAFQIKIFWIGFAVMIVLGLLIAFGVGVAAFNVIAVGDSFRWEIAPTMESAGWTLAGLGVAFLLFSLFGAIWMIAAPAIGLIRLASGRAIGQSR